MNDATRPESRAGIAQSYAFTVAALLIWSTSFIGTKIAYATFPPITLGALRFVIASAVLGVALIGGKAHVKPTLKDLGVMAVSGVLGITLYFTLENIGVSLTTASNAALIIASYPAITTLLELVIYRIKPSASKVAGILIAMAGVYLLSSTSGNEGNQSQHVGDLILVATGVVWALYSFTTRKVVARYPAVTVSFYQTIAGVICFIPLSLTEMARWQAPTVTSLAVLVYLGVMCSVAAFLLYNLGLRKLSPSTSVSLMNLVPVFGVILAVLILHETITARQLIGGPIVMAGVLLSARKPSLPEAKK